MEAAYIYIHTCVYIHTHTHTHIHTQAEMWKQSTYTYINTYIHTYTHTHIHTHSGRSDQSEMWKQLQRAFTVMEQDFKKFDQSGDGVLDYAELSGGIPPVKQEVQLSVLSRLQRAFDAVDGDGSRTLDFFEYMDLVFLFTNDGCYQMLVDSADPGVVKRSMMDVKMMYR